MFLFHLAPAHIPGRWRSSQPPIGKLTSLTPGPDPISKGQADELLIIKQPMPFECWHLLGSAFYESAEISACSLGWLSPRRSQSPPRYHLHYTTNPPARHLLKPGIHVNGRQLPLLGSDDSATTEQWYCQCIALLLGARWAAIRLAGILCRLLGPGL